MALSRFLYRISGVILFLFTELPPSLCPLFPRYHSTSPRTRQHEPYLLFSIILTESANIYCLTFCGRQFAGHLGAGLNYARENVV